MSAELFVFKPHRSFCLQKTILTVACAVPDSQCTTIANWKLLFRKLSTELSEGKKNLAKLISKSRKS